MQFPKRISITLTSAVVVCLVFSNVLAKASPNQSAREYPIEVHEMVKARLAAQRRTSSSSNQGTWGSWSPWSPCSRSCGGGVATQSRECESLQQPLDIFEDTKRRRRVPLVDRTPPRLMDNVTSSAATTSRGRKSQCVGVYKRFHLCNSQPCPVGSKDFRQSQCEAFNGKLFMGRYYMWEPFLDAPNPCVLNCRAVGFRFYATLNQSVVDGTPCHIASAPHHASHPETNKEPWICVAGQCKHVGCDGVVGSDKRWDACGECGGTNSSCRLFSGLFSNHANLQAGYNLVTTIPRGACNISVTEMTPSRSYLALRRPSGSFLLNGDWQINWAGEYEAGGVTFVYRPQDAARGEALSARGPLLEPVDLMVLYQQSNLAIKYEYTLPVSAGMPSMTPVAGPAAAPPVIRPPHGVMVQPAPHHGGGHHHGGHHHGGAHHQPPPAPPLLGYNPSNPDDVTVRDGPFNDGDTRRHSVAPNFPFSGTGPVGDEAQPPVAALRPRNRKVRKFVWRHVSFSECSKSCGGGMQTAAAICVREYNQAPVPEKRCQGQERPPPQMVRCNNKPCPAEWEAGEWSSCSATCGAGIQSRSVVCRQHISASLTMKVAEGACLGPLLERTRRCQLKPCSSSGARWSVSEWGPCAAPCGKGTRSRIVRCVASDSTDLSPESCNSDERPEEQESCDAGPCSPHHMSQSGSAQWLVSEWAQRCSEECGTGVQTRRVLCSAGSEHACDAAARPEASRACSSDKQCSGKWFAGPWGQCSASCGQGRQSRDVVCVAFVRGQFRVALDMNCQTSLKPTVERACSEQPCGPEWFMADWGSCSHGCGTGSQRREVRCLDEAYRPSSSCTQELRPTIHRACNTHACERGHSDVGDRSSEDEQNAVAPRERLHARAHHNVVPAASTSSHHGSHLQAHDAHEDSGGAGDQASQHDDEDHPKGPDCVDKFPNCNLVVQARLCKYKYYRNACCVACHRKSG